MLALTQAPEIFIKPNFGVVEYPVRRGFGTEMVKAYLLSKDGFPYAGETFLPAHPADRRTAATADDIDTMREMADFSYRQ